jgi:hypothetical protein
LSLHRKKILCLETACGWFRGLGRGNPKKARGAGLRRLATGQKKRERGDL